MQFRVLGPLQVMGAGGNEVRMHSAAQRRLMSILVLRAGTIISSETLGEWLSLTPGALRTSVCRLRRILGSDTLATAPPGYELVSDEIDARAFEGLLHAARDERDPLVARDLLERAVSLWHGDAYQEFVHEEWAIAECRRLSELRCGAIEDLVELQVATGEWSSAIAQLEPLIQAHPLHDRPRGLLMRALAESGRRADALRAYQSYRDLLVREIGTEPSRPLVELDRSIARLEV